MEFVKKNIILILSAVAVVGALVSLIFAFSYLHTVQENLNASRGAGERVESLLKGQAPVGGGSEQVVNDQAVQTLKQYNEGLAESISGIERMVLNYNFKPANPLMPDIFPQPFDPAKPFQFRLAYDGAFEPLLVILDAGDRPTPAYIEWVMDQLRLHMSPEQGAERGADDEWGVFARSERVGTGLPANLAEQAQLRAALDMASEHRIYANIGGFTFANLGTEGRPTVAAMWEAQMGLWLQTEVVQALANTNAAAADAKEKAKKEGEQVEELSVFDAPVKHLLKLVVRDYVAPGSGSRGSAKPSFTNRACNDDYDVMTFSMSVICDNRDICLLMKEMAKINLITQIGMDLQAYMLPTSQQSVSYIYGDEPLVRADMDFEAYFFTKMYNRYMPPEVRDMLAGRAMGMGMGMGPGMGMGAGMGPGMGAAGGPPDRFR